MLYLLSMTYFKISAHQPHPDTGYQHDRIKMDPGLNPAQPDPWQQYQQQPAVIQPQMSEIKVEISDHVSPDKSSYPVAYTGRSEARSGERPYRDRPRHVSPAFDDRRRSRSGSRGREWTKDWSVNGRRHGWVFSLYTSEIFRLYQGGE